MRLTLIKPTIGRLEHSLFVDEARMEPLQLGILAALTPPDVEVTLCDDRMERIPYDAPTDLVAITVETFTARRAYEIAAEYRRRGVPVVIGGMHATLLPEEVAQYADSVFTGDAESAWARVITDARQGCLKPRYDAPVGPPQPGVLTRRDLFKGKGYLPITLLQFSRGCRFQCEFCAVSAYFSRTHYCRSVRETLAEIETQERHELFFVDDNLLANHAAAKELFRALIPLKVRWVSQASLDMTHDRELMELMVKSGCLGHVIGFESIDPQNLRAMGKTPNLSTVKELRAMGKTPNLSTVKELRAMGKTPNLSTVKELRAMGKTPNLHAPGGGFDRYAAQLAILRDYGLQTWAAFTLGHDFDTEDGIQRLLDFALENRFAFAAFNTLMPYPNTPLYRRLETEGRLLYDGKWWLHPDYRFNHAAFRPRLMTPEALTAASFHCRKVYNSAFNIARRALDFKTNLSSLYRLAIYLVYNRLFRQEAFKKQGMRLGLE